MEEMWSLVSARVAVACLFVLSAAAASAEPPVPRPSPEFVLRYPPGKQELLSQYRGKVVALEFLFTT